MKISNASVLTATKLDTLLFTIFVMDEPRLNFVIREDLVKSQIFNHPSYPPDTTFALVLSTMTPFTTPVWAIFKEGTSLSPFGTYSVKRALIVPDCIFHFSTNPFVRPTKAKFPQMLVQTDVAEPKCFSDE
ncbi:hypothetical protein D3C80_1580760 [compost metagenome]